MNRFEKAIVMIAGPIVGASAAFYSWSASYAVASLLILKSSTMWKSFVGGDVLMPAKQAWAYFGNPAVSKLISAATVSMLVQVAVVAGGLVLLVKRPWQVRPPAGGSRFATLKDLESAGLLGGIPGKSVCSAHLEKETRLSISATAAIATSSSMAPPAPAKVAASSCRTSSNTRDRS